MKYTALNETNKTFMYKTAVGDFLLAPGSSWVSFEVPDGIAPSVLAAQIKSGLKIYEGDPPKNGDGGGGSSNSDGGNSGSGDNGDVTNEPDLHDMELSQLRELAVEKGIDIKMNWGTAKLISELEKLDS